MASDEGACKTRILQGKCLVYKQIPLIPKGVMADARRTGMAKTAQELKKLRHSLTYYKKAPCVACTDSDCDPIPKLLSAASYVSKTASSEHGAVLGAAMSKSRNSELHGFVLAHPGKEPSAMDFTIPNTWVFLKTNFLTMFGGKALAVACKRVSSRIDKALADVNAELHNVEIQAAAKEDHPAEE